MSEFSSDGGQEAAGQYTPSATKGLFTQIKDVSCSESWEFSHQNTKANTDTTADEDTQKNQANDHRHNN